LAATPAITLPCYEWVNSTGIYWSLAMKKISTLICAVATMTAISAPAVAADMAVKAAPAPVVALYNWTGFYVGLNAGYAWGDSNHDSTFTCPVAGTCPVNVPANQALFAAIGSGSLSPAGFTGGAQAGYNWQSANFVFGLETDFNALNLKATRLGAAPSTNTASIFSTSSSISTDWLFTFRGRIGVTVAPTVLLYGTGGLAVTDARLSNAAAVTPPGPAAGASTSSQTLTGWTAGGGVEWALSRNWTLKGEYLYVNFGSLSTTTNLAGAGFANPDTFTTSAKLNAHIARAGVNYRF
jgi:outer membrane immunogenic protein